MKKNTIRFFGAQTAISIRCAKHLAIGGTLAALLLTGSANLFAQTDRNNQFDFALIGDVPYAPTGVTSLNQTYQTYPAPDYTAMIADINNHNKVAFSVHMGDIKGGGSWCVGGNSKDSTAATFRLGSCGRTYIRRISRSSTLSQTPQSIFPGTMSGPTATETTTASTTHKSVWLIFGRSFSHQT